MGRACESHRSVQQSPHGLWVGTAGESHKDALGVCANEMGDPQLALFVSRILENSIGPLTTLLIEHELILGKNIIRMSY